MNTTPLTSTEMVSSTPEIEASVAASNTPVQLADYQLEDKLGAGGYGEVWRAIGPGGLPKAVKILYGERNGEHAAAELKSLERMRDLRHPFLLSIERIEVIDSKLIVVTELADGNLTDRFAECRKEGKKGIPRDELLVYLRDSADALDFMSEHHGLQHLDIKPDNILLQGNHAKVGDFGLAKDLNSTNVSMIQGFTPLYAAPELFEGRPGRATDQYSLAICYQAMLTGKAPFNGRTAAQLTAQHLKSQPDLSELQPVDRPVMARALSKNANSRFENCRHFVDELIRRKHSRSNGQAVVNVDLNAAVSQIPTELVKSDRFNGDDSAFNRASTPVASKSGSAEVTAIRPSIVISVGGFGGAVLREFKDQIAQRHTANGSVFPVVAVDSDRESLSELRSSDSSVGLSADETICTPLRSAQSYRKASDLNLDWLSRRWLFNIPRDCQVNGIRPLGRLALYDHRKAVGTRLLAMFQELKEDSCRETMSGFCDLPITASGVDVYVVGATSGGTSSGMLADIGLMIREIARNCELRDVEVHGLLVHGTSALRKDVDVQEANTASLMKELQHLSTPGMGTPRGFTTDSVSREDCPFDNRFFLHIGNGLSGDSFQNKATSIANFLVQATSSAAKADLQAWQESRDSELAATDQLRILGVGVQDSELMRAAAEQSSTLCQALMQHWSSMNEDEMKDRQSEIHAQLTDSMSLLTELRLTDETLSEQVMVMLRGDLGKEIEAYATHVNRELITSVDPETVTHNQLLHAVGQFLSAQDSDAGIRTLQDIVRDVQKTLVSVTNSCQSAMRGHLFGQLNTPVRLIGAESVTSLVGETLLKTRQHCNGLLRDIEKAFQSIVTSDNADSRFAVDSQLLPIEQVTAFCQQYCVLLAYQTVYQCFIQYVDSILETVSGCSQKIAGLREQMQDELSGHDDDDCAISQEVVESFDQYLRNTEPKLLTEWCESDAAQLAGLSHSAIRFLMSSTENQAEMSDSGTQSFPQNAWPVLRKLGGQRRVLGLVPPSLDQAEWNKRLTDEFGDCVAMRTVAGDNLTAICEISGVSLGTMFSKLTHDNPHIADVASRVHTRNDIDW